MRPFDFAGKPFIRFGAGKFSEVPEIAERFGKTVLLVLGGKSFSRSEHFVRLAGIFLERRVTWYSVSVQGEPSPEVVDRAAAEFRNMGISVVIAIGGGSVIDAGKAISAMLPQDGSVLNYLEGVGTGKLHDGRKIPFIAVPTTSGTGSEATKNAVLSRVGPGGFKKSIRHESFIPDYAVVDPALILSCPADITAACGMDAFTQLLESFVSAKSSPMTDALSWSGMREMRDALVPAATGGAGSLDVRAAMAYGALMSGITLANAGLGVVHGIASAIGGLFPIPHGVVCGLLLEPATRITIESLAAQGKEGDIFMEKYARAGYLLAESTGTDWKRGCGLLLERLGDWSRLFRLPRLSEYGVSSADIDSIADAAGNANNPVKLGKSDIAEILRKVR